MFDLVDLPEISDGDLQLLHTALRELGLTRNRPALDVLATIESEMLRRHRPTDPGDYADEELSKTLGLLTTAIDAARGCGISDEYPAMRFLLTVTNWVLDELERRGGIHQLQ
jgi:hypothetical protein